MNTEFVLLKLDQEHFEFLMSPDTLKQWAGMTMKMRTTLFHRQFPNKRIAVTSLRRLYLRHKVKRKKVRQEKYLPPGTQQRFQFQQRELIEKLDLINKENRKLIFLDETNFTKLSFQGKDWSCCRQNQHVDQRDIYTGYRSVIATISEDKGVELVRIYCTAVTSDTFTKYLNQLSQRN